MIESKGAKKTGLKMLFSIPIKTE